MRPQLQRKENSEVAELEANSRLEPDIGVGILSSVNSQENSTEQSSAAARNANELQRLNHHCSAHPDSTSHAPTLPHNEGIGTREISPLMGLLSKINSASSKLLERYGLFLALLAAFLTPIRLSFTLFPLVALILLWVAAGRLTKHSIRAAPAGALLLGLIAFLAVVSVFGLDPLASLGRLSSIAIYTLALFVISNSFSPNSAIKIGLALVAGQSLTSFYTLLETGVPHIPQAFLGDVTESGQLAITVFIALGILLTVLQTNSHASESNQLKIPSPTTLTTATAVIVLATVGGFSHYYVGQLSYFGIISLLLLGIVVSLQLCKVHKLMRDNSHPQAMIYFLVTVAIPILSVALVLNLKRGPWLGVTVGLFIFLWCFKRRLAPILLLSVLAIATLITPIRDRLSQSTEHFFISGGRSVIWQIGGEMALRYPLGIGYRNSPILQKFSPEIPAQLRHFHNNLINITAEGGWLALVIFLLWIAVVMRQTFSQDRSSTYAPLIYALGCGFVAWQVAGLFEYNFGDSEVYIVMLFALGILSVLTRSDGFKKSKSATTVTQPFLSRHSID